MRTIWKWYLMDLWVYTGIVLKNKIDLSWKVLHILLNGFSFLYLVLNFVSASLILEFFCSYYTLHPLEVSIADSSLALDISNAPTWVVIKQSQENKFQRD